MLRELSDHIASLKQQGVCVHVITAEKGGADEVKARLSAHDIDVQTPLHSDPMHELLLMSLGSADVHSLYVKKEVPASENGGTYEDYVMVQPALVVVDRTGAIIQTWSWNTEPLCEVAPLAEMTPVESFGGSPLVSVRPVANDIGPSIQKGRSVKLQGMSMETIMGEMNKSKTE